MLEITTSDSRWAPEKAWHDIVARSGEACARRFPAEMKGRDISVLLCGDTEMRALNRRWRGIDKATNVLSFSTGGTAAAPLPLGDIAIAWGTVLRESEQEGKSVEHHVAHLVVHGVMHLLGFDHETSDEAERMEREEREILGTLGIGDPYLPTEISAGTTRRSDVV